MEYALKVFRTKMRYIRVGVALSEVKKWSKPFPVFQHVQHRACNWLFVDIIYRV